MESKRWWQSKAVWGGIGGIVAAVGDMCMSGINAANVTMLATAAFAIYGRIVATTVIKFA